MEAAKLIDAVEKTAEGLASVDSAREACSSFASFAAKNLRGELLRAAMNFVVSACDLCDQIEGSD